MIATVTVHINPNLPWYVARSAGIVAWALVTASVIWGLSFSGKLTRHPKLPSPAWTLDLHRFLGGMSVIFAALHIVGLMLDKFVGYGPAQVAVPFTGTYRPVAVAWGIIGAYLLLSVELTSLIMTRLPRKVWHGIHLSSFVIFTLTTVHGLSSGTDARHGPLPLVMVLAAIVVAMLTGMRVQIGIAKRTERALRLQRAARVSAGRTSREVDEEEDDRPARPRPVRQLRSTEERAGRTRELPGGPVRQRPLPEDAPSRPAREPAIAGRPGRERDRELAMPDARPVRERPSRERPSREPVRARPATERPSPYEPAATVAAPYEPAAPAAASAVPPQAPPAVPAGAPVPTAPFPYGDPRLAPAYADPRFADPRFADPRYFDPRFAPAPYPDPRFADPRYDPRFLDPRYAAPGYADPRFPGPGYADAAYADPAYADPRLTDPRYADPRFQAYAGPPVAPAAPPAYGAAYGPPFAAPPYPGGPYVEPSVTAGPSAATRRPVPPAMPMPPASPAAAIGAPITNGDEDDIEEAEIVEEGAKAVGGTPLTAARRDAVVYPLRPLADARPGRRSAAGPAPQAPPRRFVPTVTNATAAGVYRVAADGRAGDRRPVPADRHPSPTGQHPTPPTRALPAVRALGTGHPAGSHQAALPVALGEMPMAQAFSVDGRGPVAGRVRADGRPHSEPDGPTERVTGRLP